MMRSPTAAMTTLRGLMLREGGLCRHTIRSKAVLGKGLLDAVVEYIDLANPACFLAVGDLTTEFARQAHELFDLLDGAHFALAVLGPEVVLDAAAHMQTQSDGHHVDRQHV